MPQAGVVPRVLRDVKTVVGRKDCRIWNLGGDKGLGERLGTIGVRDVRELATGSVRHKNYSLFSSILEIPTCRFLEYLKKRLERDIRVPLVSHFISYLTKCHRIRDCLYNIHREEVTNIFFFFF